MDKLDFKNYRALAHEVRQLHEALEALESSLFSPKGQRFTSTPRVPSGAGSTMEGAVDRHLELVKNYKQNLADKEARQLAVERAIDSLGDTRERVVMRERYILGRSWSAVSVKMQKLGVSERDMYRLHGYALAKLKEV